MRPLLLALALLAAGPVHADTKVGAPTAAAAEKSMPGKGTAPLADPTSRVADAAGQTKATVSLEQKIGQMVLVGFLGDTVDHDWFKTVRTQMAEGRITGVIYLKRNIRTKATVKAMNAALQLAAGDLPPLISIDQEGGQIERLTTDVGFPHTPSAQRMASALDARQALEAYGTLAANLKGWGFNLNLGPVADLNVNPSNPIIGKLGRAYSADSDVVADFSSAFVSAHRQYSVATAMKHFPGHGSSTRDSHRGAVDVSATWSAKELEPYRSLFAQSESSSLMMVMSGHLKNSKLQGKGDTAPMSLSPALSETLRGQLGFKGVIITDDMQMDAVRDGYSLENSVIRAVKAGNDILIFSNDKVRDIDVPNKVAKILSDAAAKDEGLLAAINRSYDRISRLKNRLVTTNSIPSDAPQARRLGTTDVMTAGRPALSDEMMRAHARSVRLHVPDGAIF